MRCWNRNRAIYLPIIVALALCSLPRFGCICADGTHLPLCQRLVDDAWGQLAQLLASSERPRGCSCCVARRPQPAAPVRGCNGSSEPCDCELTFEGPEWSAPNQVDQAQFADLPNWCPTDIPSLPDSLSPALCPVTDSARHGPPQRLALGMVRLNV
ncbi:MAG: hypothetical protein JWN70_6364 [Planctomycetaceae bacterium]|nr:hypothetical protein [Planctomycetaceae bacterium]